MPRNLVELLRDFLFGRRLAYARLFDPQNQDARAVLVDLARFCRAHVSTAHPNPHVSARLDGRREVWTRIQHHLRLDDELLWNLYGEKPNQHREE